MRVLVTGARGLLGAAIISELKRGWDVHARDRAALDVSDETAVAATVAAVKPDAIINCAAFSRVDSAEAAPVQALEVNAFGVLALARAAGAAAATLVHYSTDFVFDGQTTRPYTEEDQPNPRGVYAVSKMLGDWFALETPGAYVLRVESLFGEHGNASTRSGSLETLVDGIGAGHEVPVFVDRTVSPTYTADVAWATRQLLERRLPAGLYHCVNSGAATWHDIAREIATLLDKPLRVKPMTLETAGLAAPRPRYCALDPSKLAAAGIPMPSWQDALRRFLDRADRHT